MASSLVFGATIATLVVLSGTRDLESYETAFVSLDRGTAAETVQVLGQPVYTLALGFGVRLPLQGNLGASPAALLAPYMPAPWTYWLLMALAVAAATAIIRAAVEPLSGPFVSWPAVVSLFWSAPIVNYTIYDDWPETAVTYCASIACVFAPHALLALLGSCESTKTRRVAAFSVAAMVWGMIALAHAGHWAVLASALVLSSALALCRIEHPLRTRLATVTLLAAASVMPVALQAPDLLRELHVAGNVDTMRRLLEGPTGSLLSVNLYPFGEVSPRLPFTYLVLALVSAVVGMTSNENHLRRTAVGAALCSLILGIAATTWDPSSLYAPTITWTLRDPATAFAILSAAAAAAGVRTSSRINRIGGTIAPLAVVALAALQGPAYATDLFLRESAATRFRWNRDMTPPRERAVRRGFAPARVPPGGRLALWPNVRGESRNRRRPTTDFADAGYPLTTAWTKQRTMRHIIAPNELLFNQNTDLSSELLCDANAVSFLQLRYLLIPPDIECAPWIRIPGLKIDDQLDIAVTRQSDDRVRALPVALLEAPLSREAALSAGSGLVAALMPLPRSSLTLRARSVAVRLDDPSVATGRAMVLPVAYDAAWHASSGQVHNIGGLVALVEVDQRYTTVEFVPDDVAVLHALSMSAAQILTLIGLVGLAYAGRLTSSVALEQWAAWERIVPYVAPLVQPLRQWRIWLYVGYTAAIFRELEWRSGDSGTPSLLTGLIMPMTVLAVALLANRERWHRWGGGALLAVSLTTVMAHGSRAPAALHDPLFWALLATVVLGLLVGVRRWRNAAWTAAALAGACTIVAILVPVFPDFESRLPYLNADVARRSFDVIANQFGAAATVFLLGCWAQAIAVGAGRTGLMGAAARGALAAGLILVLAGAATEPPVRTGWMIALGVLLGLAEARPRGRRS